MSAATGVCAPTHRAAFADDHSRLLRAMARADGPVSAEDVCTQAHMSIVRTQHALRRMTSLGLAMHADDADRRKARRTYVLTDRGVTAARKATP